MRPEQNGCHFADNTGLALDILKMESWTHVWCTANIIIKDIINIFASISKNMCILLIGWCNHEFCNILKYIFLWENICILFAFAIKLKFVPKGPIDNKSALDQVMAWHLTGAKALPEPMLTQISDTIFRHWATTSPGTKHAIPRDQSRFAPSQWEMSLHCNGVSHWLGAYLDWSLHTLSFPDEASYNQLMLSVGLVSDTAIFAI